MTIISHWYDWYGVEVRGWIFLEPGEAKTTVDSHHVTVSNIILLCFINLILSFIIIYFRLHMQSKDILELDVILLMGQILKQHFKI